MTRDAIATVRGSGDFGPVPMHLAAGFKAPRDPWRFCFWDGDGAGLSLAPLPIRFGLRGEEGETAWFVGEEGS